MAVAMVQAAVQGKGVKVHTLALGEEEGAVPKQIAETGGTHRRIGYNQLPSFAG